MRRRQPRIDRGCRRGRGRGVQRCRGGEVGVELRDAVGGGGIPMRFVIIGTLVYAARLPGDDAIDR
jgi:hypothetical protein